MEEEEHRLRDDDENYYASGEIETVASGRLVAVAPCELTATAADKLKTVRAENISAASDDYSGSEDDIYDAFHRLEAVASGSSAAEGTNNPSTTASAAKQCGTKESCTKAEGFELDLQRLFETEPIEDQHEDQQENKLNDHCKGLTRRKQKRWKCAGQPARARKQSYARCIYRAGMRWCRKRHGTWKPRSSSSNTAAPHRYKARWGKAVPTVTSRNPNVYPYSATTASDAGNHTKDRNKRCYNNSPVAPCKGCKPLGCGNRGRGNCSLFWLGCPGPPVHSLTNLD